MSESHERSRRRTDLDPRDVRTLRLWHDLDRQRTQEEIAREAEYEHEDGLRAFLDLSCKAFFGIPDGLSHSDYRKELHARAAVYLSSFALTQQDEALLQAFATDLVEYRMRVGGKRVENAVRAVGLAVPRYGAAGWDVLRVLPSGSSAVHYVRGRFYALSFDYERARRHLEDAARIRTPRTLVPIVLSDYANVLENLGLLDDAWTTALSSEQLIKTQSNRTRIHSDDLAILQVASARSVIDRQVVAFLKGDLFECTQLHAVVIRLLQTARIVDEYGMSKTHRMLAMCALFNSMAGSGSDAEALLDQALSHACKSEVHATRISLEDQLPHPWLAFRDGAMFGGLWSRLATANLLVDVNVLLGKLAQAREYDRLAASRLDALSLTNLPLVRPIANGLDKAVSAIRRVRARGRRKRWVRSMPPFRPFFRWRLGNNSVSEGDFDATIEEMVGAGFNAFVPLMHISAGDYLHAQGRDATQRYQAALKFVPRYGQGDFPVFKHIAQFRLGIDPRTTD